MSAKGAYHTKQQEELIKYLRSTKGEHHTAAEIRAHFSKGEQPIGTSTIYRQLERLVQDGTVMKYVLETGDSACYEYAEKTEMCSSHFHCKCEKCGRLIHLDCHELQEIQTHLMEHHGFSWNAGKTVFYGICDRCHMA